MFERLRQKLRFGASEPLGTIASRTVRTALSTGLVADAFSGGLSSLPSAAALIRREGMSLRTVHALTAMRNPERLAFVDAWREVSYAQANEEMNRVAHGLRSLGVGHGTRVVLMSENRSELLVAWLALFRLGATAVHVSYRATAEELAWQVNHSKAVVAFVSSSTARAALTARSTIDHSLRLVIFDGNGEVGEEDLSYSELLSGGGPEFPEREPGELEAENVVYTSGTTGRPKGAVRDFARHGVVELFRIIERLPLRAGERHLVVCPLYHSAAQVFTLLESSLGSTLHLLPHFEPEQTLEAMSKWEVNSVFLVPTMIQRLLDLPAEAFEAHPTPSLRAIISGAAPFPQPLRERAVERFGSRTIYDFYGATELGWVTLIDGEEMLRRPGSVGRPVAGQELRILDETGRTLPHGEIGEVFVRNAQTMRGYLGDDEATNETRRGDWVTVNDLGYLDEDGYLYLSGRARDMVISGGVNIYPAEIEDVLLRHPAIKDAAVIGLPDPEWGERLMAVLVGADGVEVDVDEVKAFVREKLSGYKVPRRWEVVENLPRNPTGKVLKRELRELFRQPG